MVNKLTLSIKNMNAYRMQKEDRMKRFLPLLIVMILLVSIIGIGSVSAGASISGNSEVLAGKSYTYTGKASYSCGDLVGKIEGLGQVGHFGTFGGSDKNVSQSESASITVSIPSSAKPGDTYTIKFSGSYSVFGDDGGISEKSFSTSKTIKVVQKAPTPTKNPNATPRPPEGWEIVTNSVGDAKKGALVKGEMKDSYKIPEKLLKKAVENENVLEIDFGTYTCTIDPAALTDFEGIKSLNLKLDFEKAAGLTEIAGGKDVYQLHFGHSGQLPGKLTFTFKASENKPGDTVYLYYYYGEAEIVEGKMSAVVDEDGMVTFDIYHCSSYIVTSEVIEGALSNFDTESATKIDELTTTLTETQTELDEASAKIETLTAEKTTLENAVEEAQQQVTDIEEAAAKASAEAEARDQSKYSLVVLISAVAAGVLLAILLTMLFTKAGLFRKTDEEKAAKGQRREAKQQVKELKEQEKQAALEVKQEDKEAAEQQDDAVQQASGEDSEL